MLFMKKDIIVLLVDTIFK